MPQINYYIVEEVRRVEVTANNAVDAARIANQAFRFGQDEADDYRILASQKISKEFDNIFGNTNNRVEQVDLHVKKKTTS